MSIETPAAAVLVTVTLAAAVLGGPMVEADLSVGGQPTSGSGDRAALTVERVPQEGLSIRRADFGAGLYHIAGPPTRVRVGALEGTPSLKYAVDIPAIGVADSRSYELRGHEGEVISLSPPRVGLSPRWIDQDRYNVTLALWVVENGNRFRSVYQRTVTVEVEG